jgi:hypothetical protein
MLIVIHLLGLETKKIEAIKLIRNELRCGLREAKDAVEQGFVVDLGSFTDVQKFSAIINVVASINFGSYSVAPYEAPKQPIRVCHLMSSF